MFPNQTVPHEGGQATQVNLGCKDVGPRPLGLYIHLPFCSHQCPFCDFYTSPTRAVEWNGSYTDAVCREIKSAERRNWKKSRVVTSIYFGGGTPSLTPVADLTKILDAIHSWFSVELSAEVTLEINPEDVDLEKARAWVDLGINRTSLGVQSLADHELKRLERQYNAEKAFRSFALLREAGFKNMSVDLMYGLEGQTVEGWENTLNQVVTWKPEHLSAYNLTIEKKTRYAAEVIRKTLEVPDESTQVALFGRTRTFLRDRGFIPYEISNFCKPGQQSRHNQNYWMGGDYWGIGVSAHSFQKDDQMFHRWWNVRNLTKYSNSQFDGRVESEDEEWLSATTHWGERLMTGLRMLEGVDLREIGQDIGAECPGFIQDEIQKFQKLHYLERRGDRLVLTEQGLLVSDELFAQFF